MKIRKANITFDDVNIENVYIYENKKEEYTLVAIPQIQWSTIFDYNMSYEELYSELFQSIELRTSKKIAEQLAKKITYWSREM
ncbi:YueH family protein [Bacillus carboniphilus]|uniref:YueH family protein n=1 Tax=Bacillus carboniphilus TaxID=86663 RepID=A0ABY9JR27_9BACI|nr:YueH family protein [Bacillus carboniphilus]WLR41264.1 YueH family protein [Bacillus carboniphilus]